MPLLMMDLDNTLLDRDAAFRRAAAAFLAEQDVEWIMAADASGYTPREQLAQVVVERCGASERAVRTFLERGGADFVVLADPVAQALRDAVATGWTCAIVTNGRTAQQEAKIRNSGLDDLVHGWAISEGVGSRKPDPEIFRAAAAAVDATLDGAWMIGDAAHADIAGAHALGLPSVWLSLGRTWTEPAFHPTHTADDVVTAIVHVAGAR